MTVLDCGHAPTSDAGCGTGYARTPKGETLCYACADEAHGTWSGAACHRNGREPDMSGCAHNEILRAFPKLAPFAAVHCADLDGTPMHAVENAWYHYGGDQTEQRPHDAAEYLRVAPERVSRALRFDAFRAMCEGFRDEWRQDAVKAREIFDNLSEIYPKASAKAREAAQLYAVDLEWTNDRTDARVSRILRTNNPNDPSGQWSVYDVAREIYGAKLDDIYMEHVRLSVNRLCPDGGRYVGGTSGFLFDLPYAENAV